jgi:cytochrome c biogenesis protein CcmG/thiol:disulfide interchange protein DsbE
MKSTQTGTLTLALIATLFLAGAFVAPVPVTAGAEGAANRKPLPDFAMKNAKGQPVKLSSYKGKVVALNFWATWCTGCKLEIPWFVEFDQKYRSKGLAAIGVALDDEGWQTVKPYLAAHPISYPVTVATFEILEKPLGLDPVLPATLLIDRNGNIAQTHTGVVKKDEFEKQIQELLSEKVK